MVREVLLAIGRWIKGSFTKNMGMKIAALVSSFLLWIYVVTATNPMRLKTLADVPVTYAGVSDMAERGLAAGTPLYDSLGTVDVTVQVASEYLQGTTAALVQATADLSGITEAGEYTIPIRVTTQANFITVSQVVPSNVTVEIEERVDKKVPVEVQLEGEQDSSLFYGVPRLSQSTIELSGPRSRVEQVARAICTVDVSGLESSTTATHTLTLVDAEGTEIPSNLFAGVPSVIVEVPIYPKRSIVLDKDRIEDQITGLPDGYEVTSVTIEPESVEIAGPQDVISAVRTISVGPLDVAGATDDVTFENVPLLLPDDVYSAVPDEITVRVGVAEVQDTKSYQGVEVSYKNLGEGLTAVLQPSAVDVVLSGGAPQLDAITSSEILPFVDLAGYEAGTYDVPIKFENEADLGVKIAPSVSTIAVVVREE